MRNIRPISDLKDKFLEIEKVIQNNEHVILTKNGNASMVILSFEEYSRLVDGLELMLDETDKLADSNRKRLSHEELFNKLRN